MDFTDFTTGKDDIGRRLDKLVKIFVPHLPLSNIYQSIRKGLIKVNGKASKNDYRIKEGDLLSLASFLLEKGVQTSEEKKSAPTSSSPYKIRNLIVFENEHILILNKPAGINVHKATKKEISLTELVEDYYKNTRKNQSLSFNPGPLHRLDKMTRGLVCFSMSLEAAKWFNQELQAHQIKKTYCASLQGLVQESQTWHDYIFKEEESGDDFHTVKVIPGNEKELPLQAKNCITRIIPLETFEKEGKTYTKAQFLIETGRQHQIRAQSAFHGYPLAGDTAYGAEKGPQPFDLTAIKLEFPPNPLGLPAQINLP